MGPHLIEGNRIPDNSPDAIESTRFQGKCHKHIVRAGERYRDPGLLCHRETEPWIISRVADYDHNTVPETPALLKSRFDESSADTQALVILVNAESGKRKGRCFYRAGDDRDRAEEDMPDDPVLMDSNEREFRVDIAIVPQGIHEPGFPVLCECLEVNFENGRCILREFRPDDIGIHRIIFDGWPDKGDTRTQGKCGKTTR